MRKGYKLKDFPSIKNLEATQLNSEYDTTNNGRKSIAAIFVTSKMKSTDNTIKLGDYNNTENNTSINSINDENIGVLTKDVSKDTELQNIQYVQPVNTTNAMPMNNATLMGATSNGSNNGNTNINVNMNNGYITEERLKQQQIALQMQMQQLQNIQMQQNVYNNGINNGMNVNNVNNGVIYGNNTDGNDTIYSEGGEGNYKE